MRESAYGGNGACQYRLHVGTFPRPTAVVPAGGKPGEEVEVTFLGDPAGPIKQKVKLPADDRPTATGGSTARTPDGISPTGFTFRVSDVANVDRDRAERHRRQRRRPAPLPGAFNGVIAKPGEVDYFRFTAKKGQVFDVHCYARRLGSPLDPVMYLGNAAGGAIVGNDDAVGPDSYFRCTIPADGEYTLWRARPPEEGRPGLLLPRSR